LNRQDAKIAKIFNFEPPRRQDRQESYSNIEPPSNTMADVGGVLPLGVLFVEILF